jgi:hypothetical protein
MSGSTSECSGCNRYICFSHYAVPLIPYSAKLLYC